MFSSLNSEAEDIADGKRPAELHIFNKIFSAKIWQEVFINFLKFIQDSPEYDFDFIFDNQREFLIGMKLL